MIQHAAGAAREYVDQAGHALRARRIAFGNGPSRVTTALRKCCAAIRRNRSLRPLARVS